MDKEKFRRMFPHLTKELEGGKSKARIQAARSDPEIGERAASRADFVGYQPDVIDFLRRCDTEEQAIEIIDYMERRREITSAYANKLRKQLREEGVRSFGSKKGDDYYLKQAGYG